MIYRCNFLTQNKILYKQSLLFKITISIYVTGHLHTDISITALYAVAALMGYHTTKQKICL